MNTRQGYSPKSENCAVLLNLVHSTKKELSSKQVQVKWQRKRVEEGEEEALIGMIKLRKIDCKENRNQKSDER